MSKIMSGLKELLERVFLFCRSMGKWILFSAVVGLASGALGSLFHIAVEKATELRLARPWILYCLPAAGLLAVAIYKLFRMEGENTDSILQEVQDGNGIRPALFPAIFLTTVLTHLAGGSAGREGAALQMGGSMGYGLGKLFRLDDPDLRTATMIGMAGFFSALFGTPFGATLFSLGVINVGMLYHAALLPCLIAALTAGGVSGLLGIAPTRFSVSVPDISHGTMLATAALAVACGLLSVVFCGVLHFSEKKLHQLLPNPWIRAFTGGAVILALSLALGTSDYNGAGMNVITAAIQEGKAVPTAFLWKIIFTAITLGVGFKGGEVVPSFFTGAVFGCTIAPLLGLPAGFGAAVGMITVFCGAVNCPIASIALAAEMFGSDGLLFYAFACALSYAVSGYSGLYSRQRILFDKLKARSIDARTNAYKP